MKTRKTTLDGTLKPCLNAKGLSCPCDNHQGEYTVDPQKDVKTVGCENHKMHESPPERRARYARAAKTNKASTAS